jgi:LuxR family maltose regulon positive regulatory protein
MTMVLETKLHIPRPTENLLYRSRLIELLNKGITKDLVLISAPAGYGKSTLLSQWISGIDTPVCWYSIEAGDNDPVIFLTYLANALEKHEKAAMGKVLDYLQSNLKTMDIQYTVGLLINSLLSINEDFALVLEDYHFIYNRDIHECLTYLLQHMPHRMHVIIATRADPPIPLPRMRSRDQMMELRAHDLTFTLDETAHFLNSSVGMAVNSSDIGMINKRIEGWITGLKMAALSMKGRDDISSFINAFAGTNRYILDYFVEEVMERQPRDIQDFLLKTSILKQLNGPLCDAVTGQSGSQDILVFLERENLFIIPLDDDRNWYRYHHLFSGLLRKKLDTMGTENIRQLHRQAGQWFETSGSINEAVDHAIEAADFTMAERLISSIAQDLWLKGRQETLHNWLTGFPPEWEIQDTRLNAILAVIVFIDGRYDEARNHLAAAEKSISAQSDTALAGIIHAAHTYMANYQGDISATEKHGKATLELLTDDEAIWRSLTNMAMGDVHVQKGPLGEATDSYTEAIRTGKLAGSSYTVSLAQHRLAVMFHRRGQLHRAFQLLNEYLSNIDQNPQATGALYLIHSELLYERNMLDDAEDQIERAIDLCTRQHHAAALPYCYMNSAKIRLARKDRQGASEALKTGMELLEQSDVPPWVDSFVMAWYLRYQYLYDDPNNAVETCMLRAPLPVDNFSYPMVIDYVVRARLLMESGERDTSLALLGKLLQWLLSTDWKTLALEVQLLISRALHAMGKSVEAQETFITALQLGLHEGYVRTFIDEGKALIPLLRKIKGEKELADYARGLAGLLEGNETIHLPRENSSLPEPLTEREVQILRYLQTHLTTTEIADELCLSSNTVKTHIKNIYGKLDVHNRKGAIETAQVLELL